MYREPINQFIYGALYQTPPLAVLMPTNRGLAPYSNQVMKEAGLFPTGMKLPVIKDRGEIIPLRVQAYLMEGKSVLGVTGDDLWDEFRMKYPRANLVSLVNTYDWYDDQALYKKPALCVLVRKGQAKLGKRAIILVKPRYAATATQYLRRELPKAQLGVMSKGLEEQVANEQADACIDVVYTGGTLERFGLKVAEVIRLSDLVLLGPKAGGELFTAVMQNELCTLVQRRRPDSDPELATTQDFRNPERICRKLQEESYEVIQAFYGRGELVPELADLLFRATELMVARGFTLDDMAQEIGRRQSKELLRAIQALDLPPLPATT